MAAMMDGWNKSMQLTMHCAEIGLEVTGIEKIKVG
jgi:hypothetical protein